MTLLITDAAITSDVTGHTAVFVGDMDTGAQIVPDCWTVSWLPGNYLTRNLAITAMTIAEEIAEADGDVGLIASLAHELGMAGPEAIRRVLREAP